MLSKSGFELINQLNWPKGCWWTDYYEPLERKIRDIREGKEVNVLRSIPVREVMNPNVDTIQESLTMGKLSDIVSKSKHNSFPVLDTDGNLTGMLSYIDYREAVFDESLKDLVVVKELASPKVVSVTGDYNLYNALGKISVRDFSLLPVVASDSPKKLVGVLTRRDIMGAYTKAIIKKSLLIPPEKNE